MRPRNSDPGPVSGSLEAFRRCFLLIAQTLFLFLTLKLGKENGGEKFLWLKAGQPWVLCGEVSPGMLSCPFSAAGTNRAGLGKAVAPEELENQTCLCQFAQRDPGLVQQPCLEWASLGHGCWASCGAEGWVSAAGGPCLLPRLQINALGRPLYSQFDSCNSFLGTQTPRPAHCCRW